MDKKQLKFFIIITITGASFLVLSYFLNISSIKAASPAVPVGNDSMLVKELLFTVENSEGDAIGVKVMENPERLPPLLWYNQNVPNPSSPSYFTIDGYYALRDGNTVYVGALDVDTSNYNISQYIYIFSYNKGASSNTVNIFNQLLNNLKFNYNLNNLTEKSELQRDLLRIYDFSEIKDSLDNYHDSHDSYPQLASGTYIPGNTYSSWPSWQYSLSSELGQSLPVDPINRFNGPCSSCPNDPTQPDYQCNGSCYNSISKVFVHPYGSHVYEYYTSELCLGQGYSLYANLEYKPSTNDVIWLGASPTENIIINQDDNAGTDNYSISQGTSECGNEILEPCEECEITGTGTIIPEGSTCASLGLGSGTLGCDACRWTGCNELNNGQACNVNTECHSGYCVDKDTSGQGVCCNTSCQGLCQSCNISGNVGTCQLVGYGEDPRNVCPDATTCSTGFCDGFGACELEIPGTPCGTTCKYCSTDGQCLNTPVGEDYGNQCSVDLINNCKAGYCNGYGSCAYYPEGFVCANCRKCNNQFPSICTLVPANTEWGTNFTCTDVGSFACYNNWDNCDSDWSNGCEAYLLSDNQNCGTCGTVCASEESCVAGICLIYQSGGTVDYAGRIYNIVFIGGQQWLLENLNVGSRIDGILDQGMNCSPSSEIQKYCYDNDEENCTTMGGLYQWNQAMCGSNISGSRGICPDGWHIPTDGEYKILEMNLGMTEIQANLENWRGTTEGNELKAEGLCYNATPCGTSGFDAIGTSLRNVYGGFLGVSTGAYFWSSTPKNLEQAWFRDLASFLQAPKGVRRIGAEKIAGVSIRCIKDENF